MSDNTIILFIQLGLVAISSFMFYQLFIDPLIYNSYYRRYNDNILSYEEQEKVYNYYSDYLLDLKDDDIEAEEFIEKHFYIDESVNNDFEGVNLVDTIETFQLFNSNSLSESELFKKFRTHEELLIANPNFVFGSLSQFFNGPIYYYPDEYFNPAPENDHNIIEEFDNFTKGISSIYNNGPEPDFLVGLPEVVDAVCYLPYYPVKIDSEGNLEVNKSLLKHTYVLLIDGKYYSHIIWKVRFDIKIFPNDIMLLQHGW